jgi:hypothetical protein
MTPVFLFTSGIINLYLYRHLWCVMCIKYFMNASPACFNFFNDFFQGMIANETLGYFIARIQMFLILVRKLNLKCRDKMQQ